MFCRNHYGGLVVPTPSKRGKVLTGRRGVIVTIGIKITRVDLSNSR